VHQETFRLRFLQALGDRLRSWKERIAANALTGRPIEVLDPANGRPPFVADIRGDMVTIFPFCAFGLDYISTASRDDLEQQSAAVFATPLDAIANFVAGYPVVAIKRRRWWFFKAGWCVDFIPIAEAEAARRTSAAIISWPEGLS
jgi:hypothetical protein